MELDSPINIRFYLQGWVLSAPDENMLLPDPNKFIPTDLSLKTVQEKVWHIFHFIWYLSIIFSMLILIRLLIF